MRFFKPTLLLLAIVLGGLLLPGCALKSKSTSVAENQIATVQRGDLRIDITGVGNLALSSKKDLAFEIAGTVAEVLVAEGDTVDKGQELVKLDTSEWDKQLTALEDKITAAERQLTAKKRAVTTAERQLATKKDAVTTAERQLVTKRDAVTTAERQLVTKKDAVTTAERQLAVKKRNVTAKERDVLQAEINLENAQTALDTVRVTYTVAEFTAAQADVDAAKTELETALPKLSRYEPGTEAYWIYQDLLSSAQSKLNSAQAKLDDMLSGFDEEVDSKQWQVDTAQWNLESAQIAVEDALIAVEDAQKGIENAQIAVEDAQKAVENAQIAVEDAQKAIEDALIAVEDAQKAIEDALIAVEDAQKALDDAKEELDEARNTSLEIIAPSAGFITKVNVKGGDEVKKGTVAVTLADPNKFEADILVNEMDIPQVKLGGNASVQVDALPGLSLSANVTHISPTAIIQQGVVNYKVKVEIESLQSIIQERQPARDNLPSGNISSGAPSGGFRQPFAGDNLTQEQIDRMRQQRQQAQAGQPSGRQQQMPTMTPTDFQLREGLTITVSIIVEQKSNVLLIPNGAITKRRGQAYVQVLTAGSTTEERAIQTGLSDWQYTEVISGLSEGEQVIVPKVTSTTPSQSSRQPQMPFLPGGMRR